MGTPVNITNRPGYDNQPSFMPGGDTLLYTSIREDKQADTYRYSQITKRSEKLTNTPESEFSPTIAPDGKSFYTVRVEAGQSQRLWRFDLDGTNPQLILPAVKPVGYFAFADSLTVALFILGTPHTLQLADIVTGRIETVASDIGRSIWKVPGRRSISFVQKETDGVSWIKEVDPRTRKVRTIAKALEGSDFFAWTPKRILLMSKGVKLYEWTGVTWQEIASFPHEISRIAVSPKGTRIAVVLAEPPTAQ